MLIGLRPPRRIASQIFLLVAVSAVIFHLCMMMSFFVGRWTLPDSDPAAVQQIADFVNALDRLPKDRRGPYVAWFKGAHPAVSVSLAAGGIVAGSIPGSQSLAEQIRPLLPASSDVSSTSDRLVIGLEGGPTIVTRIPGPAFGPAQPPFVIVPTLLFVAFSVTIFLLWAVRNITRPLGIFADAVDGFALDQPSSTMAETGSIEVSTAARAFNRMQARIRTMIDDRTHMLASIGHDLRTPITRMRLRTEYIADDKLRTSILSDLDHMDSMVHNALSFLRDEAVQTAMAPIDVASLLQTVCDDFADMGHAVRYDGPEHVTLEANVGALRRAVCNLVGNAVSFGNEVVVTLGVLDLRVAEIDVLDDGPGIADLDKEVVFQPFRRGTTSSAVSGFGLGLPIVRAVVKAHGGTVALIDRQGGGLICRLRLPLRQSSRLRLA